jgi:DNA processing protein
MATNHRKIKKIIYSRGRLFVRERKDVPTSRRGDTAMQGTLFHRDDPAAGRIDLTREGILNAVALSTVSSPAATIIWHMISTRRPEEIYERMCRAGAPGAQSYLVEAYARDPIEAARRIIDRAEKKSIRVLTYWDNDYPPLLREIQWPPLVLYVKGRVPAGSAVAVVGTRKSDARSSANARRISRELSGRGFAIVSGMAVGIDREAHLGALEGTGTTVGVLANGIDIIYPRPNRDLYRIIEGSPGSSLVSEYPPGIFAGKWTFVRRNRIISGLSSGTVVIKAGERSGALITARHAVEQNREVFACPGGSFDEEYAGCHRLIRNGAVLVSCSDDIINELSLFLGVIPAPVPRPDEDMTGPRRYDVAHATDSLEGRILELLVERERDIDSIVRCLDGNAGEVNEAVIALELEGWIVRNGNLIARN